AAFDNPAPVPCYSGCDTPEPTWFSFPLPDQAQRDAFTAAAAVADNDGFFYEDYIPNRGVPVRFDAFIPSTSAAGHPDYFVLDQAVFAPAVVIPTNDPGTFLDIVDNDGQ